jgi:hypothetical protein
MKPIRVFRGSLSNRIYATRRYQERGEFIVSQSKDDVTQEAIRAVAEHRMGCQDNDCRCSWSSEDWWKATSQVV